MEKTVQGEPETSWSENTTPASDDLGDIDDEVEEIERAPPFFSRRSGDIGREPRFMRTPVRRRNRPDLCQNIGVTCGQQSYTCSIMSSQPSMDGSVASSPSGITIVTSATSSCADPWNSPGIVEEVDDAWNRNDEDWLVVPKEEPSEDNINMADVKEPLQVDRETKHTTTIPGKRPRGRPRKHPIISPEERAKIAKARSKTGCITCRKRKKKCDERKPGCLNCEKNAVTCEGYPQKTIWKSGKEKAEEALLRRASVSSMIVPPELSPIIHCIETPGDRMFLDHYMTRLSYIFTVDGEQRNAFQDILFPMAIEHPGLMHSLLALSGKHIDFRSPTSVQYLENHPELDIHCLEERARYHDEHAWSDFMAGIDRQHQQDQLVPSTVGQMIFLVLQTLADPNPMGAHRPHLQAYQRVIRRTPPGDDDFLRFAKEFFEYHIGLDELISLPKSHTSTENTPILPISDELVVPNFVQRDAVRLLGVFDGLFSHMSKITHLRNNVRQLMKKGVQAPFDYSIASPALDIHENLVKWKPAWPAGGDSRDLAGILYRQMLVVYLFRTIYPPNPTTWKIREDLIVEVDKGISMLEKFTPHDRSQTLILAPAFLLGCAAFYESQRIPIRKAIATVKSYMELENSNSALLVLEEVWRLMDAKDPSSWDWQTIAHDMDMDFLAT